MSVNPLNYALHQALEEHDIGAIRLLVNQKASVNSHVEGVTPLENAVNAVDVEFPKPEMVKALIDLKANVNLVLRGNWNTTVLHEAVSWRHIEVVKILLQANADVTQRKHGGSSPLHLAAMEAEEKVAKLLLNHGTHPDIRDYKARTPLHLVAGDVHETMEDHDDMEYAVENIIRTLVDGNADINALNQDGETPLAFLAKKVEKRGADLCYPGWPGTTCLSLVSHGAEIPDHLEGRVLELLSPLPISQLRLFMVELDNPKRQKLDS